MLRQSIRRSVRRLAHVLGNQHSVAALGESSSSSSSSSSTAVNGGQHQPPASAHTTAAVQTSAGVAPQLLHVPPSVTAGVQQHVACTAATTCSPPPDYTTVLVEMTRNSGNRGKDVAHSAIVCESSSSASSLSNEQSTSIECLMERAAPINVDRVIVAAATTQP